MDWHSFFDMGGYARFVWPSYGVVALTLIWQGVSSWRTLRIAQQAARNPEQNDDADAP